MMSRSLPIREYKAAYEWLRAVQPVSILFQVWNGCSHPRAGKHKAVYCMYLRLHRVYTACPSSKPVGVGNCFLQSLQSHLDHFSRRTGSHHLKGAIIHWEHLLHFFSLAYFFHWSPFFFFFDDGLKKLHRFVVYALYFPWSGNFFKLFCFGHQHFDYWNCCVWHV